MQRLYMFNHFIHILSEISKNVLELFYYLLKMILFLGFQQSEFFSKILFEIGFHSDPFRLFFLDLNYNYLLYTIILNEI